MEVLAGFPNPNGRGRSATLLAWIHDTKFHTMCRAPQRAAWQLLASLVQRHHEATVAAAVAAVDQFAKFENIALLAKLVYCGRNEALA
jgi:hypothetical protein